MRKVIDTYASAQQHVDQGMSLTLFMRSSIPAGLYEWKDGRTDKMTTRDLSILRNYAHHKQIKSIYYVRTFTDTQDEVGVNECESCVNLVEVFWKMENYKAINWNDLEDQIDKEQLGKKIDRTILVRYSDPSFKWLSRLAEFSAADKDVVAKVFGGLTLLDTFAILRWDHERLKKISGRNKKKPSSTISIYGISAR